MWLYSANRSFFCGTVTLDGALGIRLKVTPYCAWSPRSFFEGEAFRFPCTRQLPRDVLLLPSFDIVPAACPFLLPIFKGKARAPRSREIRFAASGLPGVVGRSMEWFLS